MIASYFTKNPEFIKNTRLEFNITRLGLAFILLLILLWIAWGSPDSFAGYQRSNMPLIHSRAISIINMMCTAGFLFTIIWGAWLAAGSIADEVKEKTWDFVRMSSLSPAKILAGKLFGSTAVVLVVTLFGIIPFFVWAGLTAIPGAGIIRPEGETVAIFLACLIVWAVFSHVLALVFPLINMNYFSSESRNNAVGAVFVIFMVGVTIGQAILTNYDDFYTIFSGPASSSNAIPYTSSLHFLSPNFEQWYNIRLFQLDNTLLLLSFYCVWLLVAAWRLLRKSLQFRDMPVAWVAFLVTTSLFLSGYTWTSQDETFFVWPMVVGGVTLFFSCPAEAWNIVKYKSLALHLRQGNHRETFRSMPLWMISFCFFLLSVAFYLFLSSGPTPASALSLIAFSVRDLLAVHIIFWTRSIRRPLFGFALYFGVFYGLLPLFADALSDGTDAFFRPLGDNTANVASSYWYLIIGQIALFTIFLSRRWKDVFGNPQPAAGGTVAAA